MPTDLGESGLQFHPSAGYTHLCHAHDPCGSNSTSSSFFCQGEPTSFEVAHTLLGHVFPSGFVTAAGLVQCTLETFKVAKDH